MRSSYFGILVLIFSLTSGSIGAQTFLKTEGKAIINESGDNVILRGMGLGGWMLQEGYMLQTADFASAQYQIKGLIEEMVGTEKTDQFYDAWLTNHVTRADIYSLASWGFNSVRLPMHYNLYTLPIEEEPVAGMNTWLDRGFVMTDSLIEWCRSNEMYVVLDLHATPGGQGNDQAISDYDPTKPSLWESEANREKTASLWKRLAERYADEPVIAGYDLINETNWEMTNGTPLRTLYERIMDAIRLVDQKHIIFIEGNWFANDFTGLTPPWDDNMVYSPHKYWSTNDKASIQWVLDMRNTYNVPLHLGESVENSNVWFHDAIELLEENNIGWAWWPMKKIVAIAGPLSAIKTPGYQALLDFWSGNGPQPNEPEAFEGLMSMAENLKIENCFYQKDVVDAMFRQRTTDNTLPFMHHTIPGVINTCDYDMGKVGFAYDDSELATYHVTTGNYTAWNNGWSYRNDGVDIQVTEDPSSTNGYNVGWTADGEWMQYTVEVMESAAYDVNMRIAAEGSGARLHLEAGGSDATGRVTVPSTGGYQTWQTVTVSDVILTPGDKAIRLYTDVAGYNIGSLEFVKSAASSSVKTSFVSARTSGPERILISVNKPLQDNSMSSSDFTITVNGSSVPVTAARRSSSPREIEVELADPLKSSDIIKASYSGDLVIAFDTTSLEEFELEDVRNDLSSINLIPGRIEAENFSTQNGIQLEDCTDTGGGKNIGYLDIGDYLEYEVEVTKSGMYQPVYRIASLDQQGEVRLLITDDSGEFVELHAARFPSTGGWQDWHTTIRPEVFIAEGTRKLRIEITRPQFNINWYEFRLTTSTSNPTDPEYSVTLFPNPASDRVTVTTTEGGAFIEHLDLFDTSGKLVNADISTSSGKNGFEINLRPLIPGQYFVMIQFDDGSIVTRALTHH